MVAAQIRSPTPAGVFGTHASCRAAGPWRRDRPIPSFQQQQTAAGGLLGHHQPQAPQPQGLSHLQPQQVPFTARLPVARASIGISWSSSCSHAAAGMVTAERTASRRRSIEMGNSSPVGMASARRGGHGRWINLQQRTSAGIKPLKGGVHPLLPGAVNEAHLLQCHAPGGDA